MDVELRSVEDLADVVAEAKTGGVKIVVSSHHFRRMPSLGHLKDLAKQARRAGADAFKLAARAERPADVATLLSLFPGGAGQQLSVMGMGPFGRVSRLVLARAGSVLNYGFLDQPNASGQWEATELRRRIHELADGE
jgi:3-dehydroquinate dehydratase-1